MRPVSQGGVDSRPRGDADDLGTSELETNGVPGPHTVTAQLTDEADPRESPTEPPAEGYPSAPEGEEFQWPKFEDAAASKLTLDDLEQMALANNPSLMQARAVVRKTRGAHEQVGLYPNPTVGYVGEDMGGDNGAGEQGGFVQQQIVTADKLELNQAVAARDIETALLELDTQRYRVLTDVQVAFYEVLGAQREVETALQLEQVAADGVRAAEELLEGGLGTRPDVLQARTELNQVRIELDNARIRYEAAWKDLASVLGRPNLAPRALEGALDREVPQLDWQDTYDRLVGTSPELQAALTRVERARAQLRRQEVQPIPNLLTGAEITQNVRNNFTVATARLGVFLPVSNRNQGNIESAFSELRRAQANVERLRLRLRRRLASAFRDYASARQQVEKYREKIIPDAKGNLELTEEGYREGEFDFLTVLVVRRTYFETNLAYVRSLSDLQQAAEVIDGLLLTGGLINVPDLLPALPPAARGRRGQTLTGQ